MVAAVNNNKDAKRANFDPYHKWLGISPEEQPPTHYRLLGLQAFESDREVILAAVMRQSAHLKTYQLGQHAALTQKLLNEVSAAKVCLMDPQRKAAYDARLHKELGAKKMPAAPQSSTLPTAQPLAGDHVSGVSSASLLPAAEPVVQPAIDPGLEGMFAEFRQSTRPSGPKVKKQAPARRSRKARWASANTAPLPLGEGQGVRAFAASVWHRCRSAIPPRFRTRGWFVAAGGAAILFGGILAAVLVLRVRDKDGKEVAKITVPEGGTAEMSEEGGKTPESGVAKTPGIGPSQSSDPKSVIPPPAVAPFDEKKAKEHQAAWAKHLGVPVETTNSIGMKLVLIPPGEFLMGSPKEVIEEELRLHGTDGWYKDHLPGERPQHRVRITKPYCLGATDVTQEEYERVMGDNPNSFRVESRPVEQVSWNDAVEFCRRLSEMPEEKAAKRRYALPTEAQWEYACRSGTTTRWYSGDDEAGLFNVAWVDTNAGGQTHPVCGKEANAWGLYDMHGNVWNWCQDWYGMYYTKTPTDDPGGSSGGSTRVLRGGGWECPAWGTRSAYREWTTPEARAHDVGFRVFLALNDEPRGGTAESASGIATTPPSPSGGETAHQNSPPAHATGIQEVLLSPTNLAFVETPLSDVIEYLKERHHVEIQFDGKALAKAGVGTRVPVTVLLKKVPLGQALQKMLTPLHLTFEVQHESLLITTRAAEVAKPAKSNDENPSPNPNIQRLRALGGNIEAIVEGKRVGGDSALLAADNQVELAAICFQRKWTAADSDAVCKFKNLKHLNLWETAITDEEVPKLAQLTNLEFLNLGAAGRSPTVTFRGLAQLKALSRLKQVHLQRMRRNDGSLEVLSSWPVLETVVFWRSELLDDDLQHLQNLSNLRYVEVDGTKVTSKGLVRLHESLPRCTFHADPPALEEYCNLVLPKEPNNVELHRQRAELLARYSQKWSEAAEDLAKVVELKPDEGIAWQKKAILLARLRQKDLLLEHLGKMLLRFQNDSRFRLTLAHSLATLPTGNLELIQESDLLADKLLKEAPADAQTRTVAGYVRYRADKYEDAESLLSKVDITDRGLWSYEATSLLAFRAMTKAKVNDGEAAKELLAKARESLKKAMNDRRLTDHGDYGENWWDRLSAEAVLAEAESLISGANP